jgi:hypothetical protein
MLLSRVRDSLTNNNRFWIGWLNLLPPFLQLKSILTAHNQWLPKICSIPYWTTSVSSPTCIKDSSPHHPDRLRDLSISQWNGYRSLFHQGVRRVGREANYLPPSSGDVKDYWSGTSTPPYVSMAWWLIKKGVILLEILDVNKIRF